MTKIVTPAGRALWPCLLPDAEGFGKRFAPQGGQPEPGDFGNFEMTILFDPDHPQWVAFKADLEAVASDLLLQIQETNGAAKLSEDYLPMQEEWDKENNVATGLFKIRAKKKAGGNGRKGEWRASPPPVFAPDGTLWEAPEGGELGNGSQVRMEVEPWLRDGGKNRYDMFLRLKTVQVLRAEIFTRRENDAATSAFAGQVVDPEDFDIPSAAASEM